MNKDIRIRIGALGLIPFKKGIYYYVGSAMGRSGASTLLNRVKRHAYDSSNKKNHWHIDYFLQNDDNTQITKI